MTLDPRMIQLVKDAYRKRLQGNGPPIEESKLPQILKSMPHPPTWLVEKMLAERMHLSEEDRMQQVADLIVAKHLLPGRGPW